MAVWIVTARRACDVTRWLCDTCIPVVRARGYEVQPLRELRTGYACEECGGQGEETPMAEAVPQRGRRTEAAANARLAAGGRCPRCGLLEPHVCNLPPPPLGAPAQKRP